MRRIICVGNRYRREDEAGPRVYDALVERGLPAGVEAIDGGLAGLDLLRYMEDADRVVFVDALDDPKRPRGVFVIDPREAARSAGGAYDHAAGLGYLLGVLPFVFEGKLPALYLVGIAGPPTPDAVDAAANTALSLAASRGETEAVAAGEGCRILG